MLKGLRQEAHSTTTVVHKQEEENCIDDSTGKENHTKRVAMQASAKGMGNCECRRKVKSNNTEVSVLKEPRLRKPVLALLPLWQYFEWDQGNHE